MIKAYQFLKKYGVAIGFSTGAVIVLIMYVIIFSGYPDGNPSNKELFRDHSGLFDFGIFSARALVYMTAIAAIVSFIVYLVQHFKQSIRVLVAIGLVIVLFLVTWAMGGTAIDPDVQAAIDKGKIAPVTAGDMRFIDGMVLMGYIMLILASVLALGAVIRDFTKQ